MPLKLSELEAAELLCQLCTQGVEDLRSGSSMMLTHGPFLFSSFLFPFSPFFSLLLSSFFHTHTLHSKDVRLPVNFQRSMAVEAEAVREARAKVIICMLYTSACLLALNSL